MLILINRATILGTLFIVLMWSISFNFAFSAIFVGFGVNISSDRYSTSETNGVENNFAKQSSLIRVSAGTIVKFDGTMEQLKNLVFNTTPTSIIQFNTFVSSDGLGNSNSISLQQCQINGVPTANFNCPSPFSPGNGGTLVPNPNLTQIQQDIGMGYLSFIQTSFGNSVSISFQSPEAQTAFEIALGTNILNTLMGTSSYTAQDITNAIVNGFPVASIFQSLNDIDPNLSILLSQVQIQTLSPLDPDFINLFLSSQQGIWITLQDGSIVFLETVTPLANKASTTAFSIFASLGYAEIYGRWFYGAEALLDLGNTKIGSNSDNELEVSYKFTANFIGRGGYSFMENSVNYLNLGLAFRKYNVSGFGVDTNSFKSHLVLGVGMEILLTEKFNIFTEYNHLMTLSKVDTTLLTEEKLNIKTDKLSVGFRYYFDANPLIKTKLGKISEERMEKYNVRFDEYNPKMDNYSNTPSFDYRTSYVDINAETRRMEEAEFDLQGTTRYKRINKLKY